MTGQAKGDLLTQVTAWTVYMHKFYNTEENIKISYNTELTQSTVSLYYRQKVIQSNV